MNFCLIIIFLLLLEKGKSENFRGIRAELPEERSINEGLDNEMVFDIGKRLKSNHYAELVAKKCESKSNLLSIQLEDYIIRYIRVFLFVLNLQGKGTVLEDDEEKTIDLKFVIKGKDLKFMKDMSENFKAGKVLDKLYRLDAILSSGLKQPFSNENDGSFSHILPHYFSTYLNEYILSKDVHWAIFLCCIGMLLIFRTYTYFPFWTNFFISLNFLIISEGYTRYLLKIKNAEAEDYVRFMTNSKNGCDSENRSFFYSIWNYLNPYGRNPCLDYVKNADINSEDMIFPLESILEVYKFYFLEIPFRTFGSCIRYFSEEIHGNLPSFVKYLVMQITYPLILIFFFSLIVLFMKPRLNFGGYGFNFGIGFTEEPNRIEDNRRRRTEFEGAESVETNRIENLTGSHAEGSGKEENERGQEKIALPDSHKFQVSNNGQISE